MREKDYIYMYFKIGRSTKRFVFGIYLFIYFLFIYSFIIFYYIYNVCVKNVD